MPIDAGIDGSVTTAVPVNSVGPVNPTDKEKPDVISKSTEPCILTAVKPNVPLIDGSVTDPSPANSTVPTPPTIGKVEAAPSEIAALPDTVVPPMSAVNSVGGVVTFTTESPENITGETAPINPKLGKVTLALIVPTPEKVS